MQQRNGYSILGYGCMRFTRNGNTIDFDKEEEVYQFAHTLTRMGVDDALRSAGVKDGDQVIVGTFIMDFKE